METETVISQKSFCFTSTSRPHPRARRAVYGFICRRAPQKRLEHQFRGFQMVPEIYFIALQSCNINFVQPARGHKPQKQR